MGVPSTLLPGPSEVEPPPGWLCKCSLQLVGSGPLHTKRNFSGRDIERSPGNASVPAVQLRSYGSSVQIMKTPLEEAYCSEDGRVVEWKVHREERGVRVNGLFMERVFLGGDQVQCLSVVYGCDSEGVRVGLVLVQSSCSPCAVLVALVCV